MTRPRDVDHRSFDAADAPAAGRLLAARHARHRRAEPLLAARYEDPAVATAEVQSALDAGATGAVAVAAGAVTAYLLGQTKADPVWGPNVWVESAGQAASAAEVARDLYAAAATGWVERGLDAHYVLVPAHDSELVDAWFRLGFGLQHVHGIREVSTERHSPAFTLPAGIVIRAAERGDIPVLAEIDLALPRHQALAPTFSAGEVPTYAARLADWEESFDDEGFTNLVAEHDGLVVGAAVGCPLEESSAHLGPARPDGAAFLGFAAVLPAARGLGAGRALGEAVLSWASASGFSCVVTDWRSANLLSSRTWPRLGFRPSFLRLHRRIGF